LEFVKTLVDDSTPQVMPLEIEKVDSLLTAGGTVLGTTNKGDPLLSNAQWHPI